MIIKYQNCESFAKKEITNSHKFIIYVMEYHFTSFHFFCKNLLQEIRKELPFGGFEFTPIRLTGKRSTITP